MPSLEQKRSVIRESGFRILLLSRWKKMRMQRTHDTYSDDAVRNVIFTFRTIEFCLGKKIFTIRAGITCFLFLCFVRFPKHTSYPCWINVFYVQKIWTLVQITLSKEKTKKALYFSNHFQHKHVISNYVNLHHNCTVVGINL